MPLTHFAPSSDAPMIQRQYQTNSCTLVLETQLAPASLSEFSLSYPFQTLLELANTSLRGDGHLARDLVTVADRYLQAYLRGEPQGMFSSAVAIRPLDFLSHRLTVRDGDSIKQADLTMTDLYDLTEVLADFQQDFPQIVEWIPKPARAQGLKSPAAIAALFVGAVGVTVGVSVWNNRSQFVPAAQDPQVTITALRSAEPVPESAAEQELADTAGGERAPMASAPAAKDPSQQLRQRLLDAWRTPASVTSELVYEVTVDPQGQILSAVPQDDVAQQAQLLTPFAAAPRIAPADVPAGTQVFTVRFGELNRVVVEP